MHKRRKFCGHFCVRRKAANFCHPEFIYNFDKACANFSITYVYWFTGWLCDNERQLFQDDFCSLKSLGIIQNPLQHAPPPPFEQSYKNCACWASLSLTCNFVWHLFMLSILINLFVPLPIDGRQTTLIHSMIFFNPGLSVSVSSFSFFLKR